MLTGLTTFVLLLIALLAIPVTLTFEVAWRQVLHSDIKLRWAFGLVRVTIPPIEPKIPATEGEEPGQKVGRYERSPGKKRSIFAVVRQKELRRRIFRFVHDVWHAIHKKDLSLRVRIGLGDPADTGQLWAVCGPVAALLANVQEASIDIEPEFLDAIFELDSSGSIRIIPLQMIYLTVALLLSPPVWQGIRKVRAGDS